MMNPINLTREIFEQQISYAVQAHKEGKSCDHIITSLVRDYMALPNMIKAIDAAFHPRKWSAYGYRFCNTDLKIYLLILRRMEVEPVLSIVIKEEENLEDLIVQCIMSGIREIRIDVGRDELSLVNYLRINNRQDLVGRFIDASKFPFFPSDIPLNTLGKFLECNPDKLSILRALKNRGFPLKECIHVLTEKQHSFEVLTLCGAVSLPYLDFSNEQCRKKIQADPDLLFSSEMLKAPEASLMEAISLYPLEVAAGREEFYLRYLSCIQNKNIFSNSWNLKNHLWADILRDPKLPGPYPPFDSTGLRNLWLLGTRSRSWLRPYMEGVFTADQIRCEGAMKLVESVKDFPILVNACYIPTEVEKKWLVTICKNNPLEHKETYIWTTLHLFELFNQNQWLHCLEDIFAIIDLEETDYFPVNAKGETLIHLMFRTLEVSDFCRLFPNASSIAMRYGHYEDKNGVSINAVFARSGFFVEGFEDRAGWRRTLAGLESPILEPWALNPKLPVMTPLGNSVLCLLLRKGWLLRFASMGYEITLEAACTVDKHGNRPLHEAIKVGNVEAALAILQHNPLLDMKALALLLCNSPTWEKLNKTLIKSGFNPYIYQGLVLPEFLTSKNIEHLLRESSLFSEIRQLPRTRAEWTALIHDNHYLELIPYILDQTPENRQWVQQHNTPEHRRKIHKLMQRSNFHEQIVLNWYFTPSFPQPMLLQEPLPEVRDFSASGYFTCLEQVKSHFENPEEIKEKIRRILSIVEEKKPLLGLPNAEREPDQFFQAHGELCKLFTLFLEKLEKLPEEEMASALLLLSEVDEYCAERWFEFLSEYLQRASSLAPKESFKEYLTLELQTYRDTLLNQLTAGEEQQVHVMHMFHRKWGDELGMPRTRTYFFDDPVAPDNTADVCSTVKERFCKIYHQESIEIACKLAKKKSRLLIDWQRANYPLRGLDTEEKREEFLASGKDFCRPHHALYFMVKEGFTTEVLDGLQAFIVSSIDGEPNHGTTSLPSPKRAKIERDQL